MARLARKLALVVGVATVALAMAVPAGAKQCAGVSLPDTVKVDDKDFALTGLGLLRDGWWLFGDDVYVVGLYLNGAAASAEAALAPDRAKRLDVVFAIDRTRDQVNDIFSNGLASTLGTAVGSYRQPMERLISWLPAMNANQGFSLVYRPGGGMEVFVNGDSKGTITDEKFVQAVYAIWLGDEPPSADLKAGLLGGQCG